MTGLVLVTGLLMVPVAGAVPSVHAAVEPVPGSSWAGSRAGEGRERPGRPDAGLMDPEDLYGVSEEPTEAPDDPAGTATPEPSRNAASPVGRAGAEAPEGPVLEALALGGGLMLMGIGLGLAFVGLRIRRG
ncbi:hypothetical protein [Streptomyces ossamyceticus]|uniref:hypothetical protein n=1 Tax=Streptomyces ossamyceticus TaxID=249581 RepID=UPI003EBAB325